MVVWWYCGLVNTHYYIYLLNNVAATIIKVVRVENILILSPVVRPEPSLTLNGTNTVEPGSTLGLMLKNKN